MKLLSPVSFGALELAHLMRALEGACRLRADGVPDERMSHYYLRRASAVGLIIAEPPRSLCRERVRRMLRHLAGLGRRGRGGARTGRRSRGAATLVDQ
jgi:2,4-dienoyl-CoA reductase-like NADH-dependent reductase (Old Yellow Enzyme family)